MEKSYWDAPASGMEINETISLRRMYQTAQQDMQSKIKALINKSGDLLMEQEQHVYGWDQPEPDGIMKTEPFRVN